jgi:hypothetical protein
MFYTQKPCLKGAGFLPTGAHESAPVRPTGAPSKRACLHYRRALKARLFALQARAHARLLGEKARTHARVSPGRPRMWAHPLPKNPLKTLLRPPVPTLPKKLNPTTMQDVKRTNLNLARQKSGAWCSQNR